MGPKGWEDGGSWLGQRKTEQHSKWVFVVWGFFSSPWAACSEALQKSKFMHGNGRVFILISFLGTDLCINAKMQMKLPTGFKERRKDGWVLQWVFCGFFFSVFSFCFCFYFKPFGETYVLQSAYPECWDSSFLIMMRNQKLFESPSNCFVLFV